MRGVRLQMQPKPNRRRCACPAVPSPNTHPHARSELAVTLPKQAKATGTGSYSAALLNGSNMTKQAVGSHLTHDEGSFVHSLQMQPSQMRELVVVELEVVYERLRTSSYHNFS